MTEAEFRAKFGEGKDPTWFMALWDFDSGYVDNTHKDWAGLLHTGIMGTCEMDVQVWLDQEEELFDEDAATDEGDVCFEDYLNAKLKEWGFTQEEES